MVVALVTFLTVFLLTIMIGNLFFSKRRKIVSRLQYVAEQGKEEEEEILSRPFTERIILPALEKLGKIVARLTPKQIKANLDRRLLMAGAPFRQQADRFVKMQGASLLLLPAFTLLLTLMARLSWLKVILSAVLALFIAFWLPVLVLELRIKKRQREIQNSLPNAMDLLVVSVEAGLGFDMALAKVAEKLKGTLGEEFGHTLNEIRLGRIRRMALRDLAARTGVPDFTTFISSVIQADQLGVSIGNVLRVQADAIRDKRRQRFQEAQ